MKCFKKTALCLLIACLLLCMGVNAAMAYSSYDYQRSGLPVALGSDFQTRVLSDGTLEITGYTGKLEKLRIPQKINGRQVTAIGEEAFYSFGTFVAVEIPEGVTRIGKLSFAFVRSLEWVKIPSSVKTIEDSAFVACLSLTEVVFSGNGLSTIGNGAFFECVSLTSIELPSGVTSIGNEAFRCCDTLESIKIPASVKRIGESAISDCPALKTIYGEAGTAAERLANDYGRAFVTFGGVAQSKATYMIGGETKTNLPIAEKSDFKTKKLDDGTVEITKYIGSQSRFMVPYSIDNRRVTSIGQNAFQDNTALREIEIPEGVEKIGIRAFSGCTNLERVTLPQSVTDIGKNAFYRCASLYAINLPVNIKAVRAYTFYGCRNLTSIQIPDFVTDIGTYAFYGCEGLTSVVIPQRVTSIGEYAFSHCSDLMEVLIPASATKIPKNAFETCPNLCYISGKLGSEAEKLASKLGIWFVTSASGW